MKSILTVTMNPAIDVSTSVDRLRPVHKLRCTAAQHDPGGGGINVARVVHKLGGEVTAVYPVGGATGQFLRRIVEKEGIHGSTFEVCDETRLSFTVLESETGDEYRFVLPGPPLSEPEGQQCIEEINRLPDRPGILVMSGSLPPGVPDDFYARVARMAKDWRTKLVLDTSGPALSAALLEGMYLIKPNLRELRELTGRSLDDEKSCVAACRGLVEAGKVEIVALTLGNQGALLFTQGCTLRAPALPIEPVSTVGAGDSFMGAMVWALAIGHSLEDAFRYGVAAGSAALITPGTELCRLEDIKHLYSQVVLHAV
jgi:6-phosphofructokinase 2